MKEKIRVSAKYSPKNVKMEDSEKSHELPATEKKEPKVALSEMDLDKAYASFKRPST